MQKKPQTKQQVWLERCSCLLDVIPNEWHRTLHCVGGQGLHRLSSAVTALTDGLNFIQEKFVTEHLQ